MSDEPLRIVEFTIDDQRYGIPLADVERVLPMVAIAPLPGGPSVAIGVINVHGAIVPVIDIRRRFGLNPQEIDSSAQLLLTRTPRRLLALAVEEVIGVSAHSPSALVPSDNVLPHLAHLAGIVPLEDDLLFLQDMERFLSLEDEQQMERSIEELVHDAVS